MLFIKECCQGNFKRLAKSILLAKNEEKHETLNPTVFLSCSLVHPARYNSSLASYFARHPRPPARRPTFPPSSLCTLARLVVLRRVPGGGGCRRAALGHEHELPACLRREEMDEAQHKVGKGRWRWSRTLSGHRGGRVDARATGRPRRTEVEDGGACATGRWRWRRTYHCLCRRPPVPRGGRCRAA
jgi:hypothetical protein